MFVDQTLTIHTKTDVIRARVEVREAARRMGLDTRDQALISLATSSLADALGLGTSQRAGTITIEGLNGEKNNGLRVICICETFHNGGPVAGLTRDVRWMVDALDIRDPVDDQVEVVLTKWAT
jgi:hypothetical protein